MEIRGWNVVVLFLCPVEVEPVRERKAKGGSGKGGNWWFVEKLGRSWDCGRFN